MYIPWHIEASGLVGLMTTTEDQNNQGNNQFGALVSNSNSEDLETTSATQRRHSAYIQEVIADQQELQVNSGGQRLGHRHWHYKGHS